MTLTQFEDNLKQIRSAMYRAYYNGEAHAEGDVTYQDVQVMDSFLKALENKTFCFEYESWHTPEGVAAYEMLVRAYDGTDANGPFDEAQRIDLGHVIKVADKLGMRMPLDQVLVREELLWAHDMDLMPVTINLSMDSIYSEKFWVGLELPLKLFGAENIIFEILEDPIPEFGKDRIAHLRELRDEGFRFAMDDYHPCLRDEERMEVLGEIVDFVKMDGNLVRKGLSGQSRALDETIEKLSPYYNLVAEWVESVEEADTLFKKNVHSVQGRDLPLDGQRFRIGLDRHRTKQPG